jgi:bacterial/archaeal transporter family-2 protein
MPYLLILVSLCMGAASAVQGATNGTLAMRIGLASAMMVNASIVFGVALVVWLATRRPLASELGGELTSPWYLYVGGLYGLFIIGGAAFAFPRFGAGPTTALMVAAQLGTALVLDHLGVPSGKIAVTPTRVVGVVLLAAGAALVLWPKLAPRDT